MTCRHLFLRGRLTLLLLCFPVPIGVLAVRYCPHGDESQLICPENNTCCNSNAGNQGGDGGGCIASDLGALNGTCCQDDDSSVSTGCGVHYECSSTLQNGTFLTCKANSAIISDPLVQVLPRYVLCRPPSDTLLTVQGLPVVVAGASKAKLAYYSSHGDILHLNNSFDIQMALVIIHGAGRNADDYFCSATAAVKLQQKVPSPDSILVIAPRFLETGDSIDDGNGHANHQFLYWNNTDHSGSWRYGANAVAPKEAIDISSYDAVDHLMQILINRTLFPSLQHITIAGHSSGGQFVQRWALLTSFWHSHFFHAVVANPSSYAYLTPERWIHGSWQIPTNATTVCPSYNQWEWGLESGGSRNVPYLKRALDNLDLNMTRLRERFGDRSITYLAGSLDRCNVSDEDQPGWCYSHGLETTCMDELQGNNRWVRSHNYMRSIRRLGIRRRHHRHGIVDGVGHDHSLIFTSPVGLNALFPVYIWERSRSKQDVDASESRD